MTNNSERSIPLTSKNLTLLRCPFCGAGDPDIRAKTLEPAFSYVHCERCGAQGPCTSDEPHAEVAWNTRQPDERARLRAALSHVKGRAQLRDSATLLDITRLVDEALSGEPGSVHETTGNLPGDGTRRAAFNEWWQMMWKDNDPRSSPGFDEQMRSWSLDAWQAGAAHERDRIAAMRPAYTNYAHIAETMDIRSPVGSRIVFANPRAGWPADVANANRWLVEGQTYTISRIDICSSITRVWLKELPDYGPFNSVQFRNESPSKASECMPPEEAAQVREAIAVGRVTFPPEIVRTDDPNRWLCHRCGEHNDARAEQCWSCFNDRTAEKASGEHT